MGGSEMTFFPRHPILRVVAVLWLLAAVVLLLATLLRPEIQANERAALSSLVPLYFLSLPLGHLGVRTLGGLKVDLYVAYQCVPGIFTEGLALWALLTVLGYVQWFVLLPWVAGKCRLLADFLSKRYRAR
jgi:uncharacterized protein YqjF (DUF2071 family)